MTTANVNRLTEGELRRELSELALDRFREMDVLTVTRVRVEAMEKRMEEVRGELDGRFGR